MIVLSFGLLMAFVTIPTLSELWRYQKHMIDNPDFESRQKAEKKRIKLAKTIGKTVFPYSQTEILCILSR